VKDEEDTLLRPERVAYGGAGNLHGKGRWTQVDGYRFEWFTVRIGLWRCNTQLST